MSVAELPVDHMTFRVTKTGDAKTYAVMRESDGKLKADFTGTVSPDLPAQLRALADEIEK